MRIRHSIAHVGVMVLLGCLLLSHAEDEDNLPNPFPHLIHVFDEDKGNLERYYRFRHSQLDQDRLEQFYQDYQSQLEEIAFDRLNQEGKIDYLLFRNLLNHELAQLAYWKTRTAEVEDWVDFAPLITELTEKRRRAAPMDWQKTATKLSELGATIGETASKLEENGNALSPVLANRVSRLVNSLRRDLSRWHRFYHGYDPVFDWWNEMPYQAVESAIDSYLEALQKKVGGEDAVVGDPIGREALLMALDHEFIAYTPEELIAIAEQEYAWCAAEWKRAARELGFEDDWKKALDHVKSLHVAPGNQPALIKDLADEAVEFLETRDLITIPPICKETWRMEMMTAERQKVNPYFTGGEVISVSFPTHEMAHEDKLMSLRGNNRHFCKATVHHELIPGHHLQIYMQERHRPYRKIFRTPFLVEGWALYWEMLLWDKDFHEGPEDRVGMLFWRTHRCARIIFSLKFHLGTMTAEECIDYLVEEVGHERRNATAEVRRSVQGGYEPLYQAAYMLGGLQFRALRRELVDSGEMTEKEFHDAILKENSIPVDMIRASMDGTALSRDYASGWRFYHDDAENSAN